MKHSLWGAALVLLSTTAAAQPASSTEPPVVDATPAAPEAAADTVPPTSVSEPAGDAAEQEAVAPETATAAPATPPPPSPARVVHAPPSVTATHRPFTVEVDLVHPELIQRALLVYRTGADGELLEVEFMRAAGGYAATIEAEHVRDPHVSYTIELELTDGSRKAAFASRERLHFVQVGEEIFDVREKAQLERLGGRRSEIELGGEWVSFGKSDATFQGANGALSTSAIRDGYYRLDGAYSYRPLRFVNEFSIRFGWVRGQSPVDRLGSGNRPSRESDLDVGLNYAAPSVRLRFSDRWHVEPTFVISVTEVDFSVGAGAKVHIGDVFGSKLVLGFESIQDFGTRGFSRVDVVASDHLVLSPIIEVTDMPNADSAGVRLLGELTYRIGSGFSVFGRGGYQAREAASGGPSVGGGVALAF